MAQSEIVDFLTDQNVFITGGTGFLGKILVEKLLRSCNVKRVFILIRTKKNKTIEERIDSYFNFACFDNLKEKGMLQKEKLVFISGNLEEINLGLSLKDQMVLLEQVSIIIHAAANVKFDQSLKESGCITTKATMDLMQLALKMPQLKSFVYVSTAFSNCVQPIIEEKCYTPIMTAEQLMLLFKAVPDDDVLAKITPILLQNWPNTYTFGKSLTEHYLYTYGKSLPLAIVRPAIVGQTDREPMPGWIDNFYGFGGLSTAAAMGALRSFRCKVDSRLPLIPADFVTNLILAVLWDNRVENKTDEEIKFYNISSSESNSLTYGEYVKMGEDAVKKSYALSSALWCVTIEFTNNKLKHKLRTFFAQTLVAYLVDICLVCLGKVPKAVEANKRLIKATDSLSYFANNEWHFKTSNSLELWNKLNSADKELFNFDTESLNLLEYFDNFYRGARIYLLKDPMKTLPQAKIKYRNLTIAHHVLTCLLYLMMATFITFIVKCFF